MTTFLEEFSQKLVKLSAEELRNTLVILPNRRAKLYVQKYLSQQISQPLWTPEFVSINDFIFSKLALQECKGLPLLIELYKAHQKIDKKNPQSLDQFSSWAELLISDFNEIDLYQVPVTRLFTYLSDAKRIAQWDLEPDNLSQQEKSYLKFYESLEKYYHEFHNILLKQNMAYQGMAYRMMAENMNDISLAYSNIYIVGFNALSPAENTIIKHLEEVHQAEVHWDIDRFYYENPKHEAGHFLRQQLQNQEQKKIKTIADFWATAPKSIDIYGVDGNIGQVKLAAQLLQQQLRNKPELESQTAVILGNEDLMIPMISSMPDEVSKFNLTMSYPLRMHSGYDLTIRIISLLENTIGKENPSEFLRIYHKHFIGFLQHPFIQNFLNKKGNNPSRRIISQIQKENRSQVELNAETYEQFNGKLDELIPLFSILNQAESDPKSALKVLINFFTFLHQELDSNFDESFLSHFVEVFEELQSAIDQVDKIDRLITIKKWIINAINQSPIPFTGEPLEGMQVMGMLETRTLDFENIIMLSVNEGVLPKTPAYQSFILFDIKKEFNMPLPMENDAITAYHFYRLLQRANSISLIYNLSSGGMNASEASRFIKQIELEMPIYNPAVKIKHHKIQFPLPTSQTAGEIIIEKTEEVQSQIEKYIREKSFSPSTLNNYKKCSYLFYLQKIVGLKKEQEVEEQMAYNTQGDLIHNTLEDFYNIFDGKPITTKEFENRKSEIMTIFNHRLETDYKNLDTSFGKNLLTKEILKQFLQHFIAIESEFAKQVQQYNIEGLELEVENSFIIDHQNSPLEIRFKGSADRIDSFGNTLRIVDYKTGAVDATHLAIDISRGQDQWEYMFNEKYDKAFQLMMYAWMYWKTAKPGIKLQSGIIAFKSHAAFLPLKLYKNEYISEADLQRFEEDLKVLIDDMLNPAIPFVQRNNDRVCEYCDYRQICMR